MGHKIQISYINDGNLKNLNCNHAFFSEVDFSNSIMDGIILEYAFCGRASFANCSMDYVNCIGTDFTEANLEGVSLKDANLTGANLIGANLKDTIISGTNVNLTDIKYNSSTLFPKGFNIKEYQAEYNKQQNKGVK